MAFTADEIANISNSALEFYIDKGKVHAQNIQNKPLLKAFQSRAGSFNGGNEYVSLGIKSGQGGLTLSGYTGDDQVSYGTLGNVKRVRWAWKEHHMGYKLTMTEMKIDGIDVTESGADQSTSNMSGREEHVLANILENKNEDMGEDYNNSLNSLLHGDGSADSKALAGIGSFILENPDVGSTGGVSRVANSWWRNRALTTTGGGVITASATAGGALITALDKEFRQLGRYAGGIDNVQMFAGSDFIDAYKMELRSNGYYSMDMAKDSGAPDGSMKDPTHGGKQIIYDPWYDDNGKSKFMHAIDMGKNGIRLLYMDGQRLKRHHPARPYDRYVMYNGITMTGVMVAKRLNSSGVYEIA